MADKIRENAELMTLTVHKGKEDNWRENRTLQKLKQSSLCGTAGDGQTP